MSDELMGKLVDPPGKGDVEGAAGDAESGKFAGDVDFLTGSM
jgi:hypothetical protein